MEFIPNRILPVPDEGQTNHRPHDGGAKWFHTHACFRMSRASFPFRMLLCENQTCIAYSAAFGYPDGYRAASAPSLKKSIAFLQEEVSSIGGVERGFVAVVV
jgi:hypothetical protein